MPEEYGSLTALTKFDLGANHLTSISSTIGRMTKLVELRLDANQLSGRIPEELGKLIELTVLNITPTI
jgi:Leucine-rich repeat (LRR) protein